MPKQERFIKDFFAKEDPYKMAPSLVVLDSGIAELPERCRQHMLEKKKIVLGTADDVDIQFPPGSMDRHHAEIRLIEQDWHLFDLTNSNGLLVNNIPVKILNLYEDGQVFQLGRSKIKYLSGQGEESRCFAEMYRRDVTDFLTNVYNKEFFHKSLDREILRASRYKRKLSLILMDLDEFGKLNKQYGQLTGDAVLQQVAGRMKQTIRTTDILGRIGGEEFGVICPETDLKETRELAERLRLSLDEAPFIYQESLLRMTVSIGVSTLKTNMLSREMIETANEYMKMAKKTGRNRVESE